jgi:hypothetical protein
MLHPRPCEPTYLERQVVALALVLVALPRLMLGHTINHGATAMLVWGLIGLLLTRPPPRIPRAIVLPTDRDKP